MHFAYPHVLLLLAIIPVLQVRRVRGRTLREGHLYYSDLSVLARVRTTGPRRWRTLLYALRLAAIALVIVAAARPQSVGESEELATEGADIVLALDISGSMRAIDFKPKNRLYAAKKVAADFIERRRNDRIGLVVFAGHSFTQCPLTLDHQVVRDLLAQVDIGMVEDGTAIGMALATSINRLRGSPAASKVVILLTDGNNNRGEIDPITAAQMAKAEGIKVYTVAAGKRGLALFPVEDAMGKRFVRMAVEINEESLQQIAHVTGGRYFRATDTERLEEVYSEISELEKTRIDLTHYRHFNELFFYPALAALLLLSAEMTLRATWCRTVP